MSNTRFPTHAWGLLYLTNHHIHDYKLQALHEDFIGLQQLARRVFIDQGAVTHTKSTNRLNLTSTRKKAQSSESKLKNDHM
jgi:hypothetical protein